MCDWLHSVVELLKLIRKYKIVHKLITEKRTRYILTRFVKQSFMTYLHGVSFELMNRFMNHFQEFLTLCIALVFLTKCSQICCALVSALKFALPPRVRLACRPRTGRSFLCMTASRVYIGIKCLETLARMLFYGPSL